jgi:death-on-curing protein
MERIDLDQYLQIATELTGMTPEALRSSAKISLIESALQAPFAGLGEIDAHPEFFRKAAILCSRLTRNHPLPDGNKRCALLAMILFVETNGRAFDDSDQDDVAEKIEQITEQIITESQFADWVREHID